jgi:hypothetical protein
MIIKNKLLLNILTRAKMNSDMKRASFATLLGAKLNIQKLIFRDINLSQKLA